MGISIEHTRITVDEYPDKWLEVAAKPRLRARTFDDYRSYLARYIRPRIGKRKLSSVSPLDIQVVYSAMEGQGLTGRTIRYAHAILASAFKQAVKWQILHSNATSMVELPKIVRREMSVLSREECAKFLEEARTDRWYVVFSLALASGMRPEEDLGLQWKDVDLASGTVTIQRALCMESKGWRVDPRRAKDFEEPKDNSSAGKRGSRTGGAPT